MRHAERTTSWLFQMIIVLVVARGGIVLGRVLYVDRSAKGDTLGLSWANAATNLEVAIHYGQDWRRQEGGDIEIRVAQGVYKATRGGSFPRSASFQLCNGITLRGGYAGLRGEDPNARDIVAYATILSGDRGSNDTALSRSEGLRGQPTRADNNRNVVRATDVNETAVLDGFIITGGYCEVAGRDFATGGGGLETDRASPTIMDCTFVDNCVVDSGGAVLNSDSAPKFLRCTFQNNFAWAGGAILNERSSPLFVECHFVGNYATFWGGAALSKSSFLSETGTGSNPTFINCRFAGNWAPQGSAVYTMGPSSGVVLNNCLFAGNVAQQRGCLFNDSSHTQLNGCILWDNRGSPVIVGAMDIKYSDIQGGWPGEGNMNADPWFARPGYWGPNNAFWVDGDYHLKSQGGRWDPNSQGWVMDEVTSPCLDAGDPNTPVGDEPAPNGGRINMGAYGGTAEASKSNKS